MPPKISKDKATSGRRITVEEMAEILSRANKDRKDIIGNPNVLDTYNSPIESKTKKYFSKSAILGAPEKIFEIVKENPSWGPARISSALSMKGILLTRQSVFRFLAKHNLSLKSDRQKWSGNQ
jgi:hypothetical protein